MKFFAICQFYEPFVMGGSVWPFKRFEVEAELVELINNFHGFGFQCPLTKEFRVHEKTTGGLLGTGSTLIGATHEANKNIETTPDLADQISKLGDTSQFPIVEAEEALRRIAKSK